MSMTLLVALFLAMTAAAFCLGAAALVPGSVVKTRLRSLSGVGAAQPRRATTVEKFEETILDPLSKALPKSPDEVSHTRQLLMLAGYREPRHLAVFFGLRVLLALCFFLVALGWAGFSKPLLLVAVAALGYLLPRFVLKSMIKRRQLLIRLGLPDALDLAVICTEAGLGLDKTVQRVGEELAHVHPELSSELNLVNLEMRAGKSRADALRNLAARTEVDDVRSLVALLVQTDRFGTSIAHAFRVHSDAMRTERRQRAEEQAAKTTIKMVPVLVFFVFPSMFIVALGPAFITLVRNLVPIVNK
jgi:tight adherence protein C